MEWEAKARVRECRGHVSAFSYMVRQTNNSGLVSKVYMERQTKSGEKLCLGIQDKGTKMHIKQKPVIGVSPKQILLLLDS